jgi:hypothetical protein
MDVKSPFILNKIHAGMHSMHSFLLFVKAVFTPKGSKNSFLVRWGVMVVIGLLFTQMGIAQTTGDYRTRYTGARNWSTASNWQRYNGSTWANATVVPSAATKVTIQNGANYTVNANATCLNLTINDGGTLNVGAYNLTVSGTTTIGGGTSGTLNITGYNGTKIFTGLITINSGGTWNNSASSSPVTFRGGITNNGTFTPGSTWLYTFDTNAQSLNGNIDMSGSSVLINGVNVTNYGTLTLSANLNGSGTNPTLTNATTGTLNLSGSFGTSISYINNQGVLYNTTSGSINTAAANFTNIGTINVQNSGYIAGITNNTGGLINISSTSYNINTLTATATGNTVTYNGSGDQTVKNTTYYNLTISGDGTKTLGGSTTVTGVLTLTNGVLAATSSNLLSITNTATSAITGGSSASYIDGPVKWSLPASSSGSTYIFPMGDGGDYKPFSLVNPVTGTGTITAQVEAVKASSGGSSSVLELSTDEYWILTPSGNLTSTSVSLGRGTAIYPFNAIATSTTLASTSYASKNGTTGTYEVSNSESVTLGGGTWYFVLGKASPTITVSTTALSGFTYAENNGPSAAKIFTVSGVYHTSNITVSLPVNSNYELSTDGTNYSGIANVLINAGGTASSTTIYVRLKAGLAVNTSYSDVITASATGATSKTISLSGSVTNQPLITVNPTSLTGFGYVLGYGPSTAQSFTVTGTNLQGSITITASTNFEISTTSATTGFTSTTLTLTSGTVWVRLKSGLSTSTYNEDITLTATYATTKTVNCQGVVNRATINVSNFTLGGFIYTSANGPSGVQSFTVSGTTLSANIIITPPVDFQISSDNSTWVTSPSTISLPYGSGTISPTTIYVRMKSGLSTGIISSENIKLTSTNAIQQNVACSGAVVSGTATISSNSVMNGFFYIVAKGPSLTQSITVSGTSLGSNAITVTAPADFEVSTSSSSGFGSSLTISPSGGLVNAVPVYIRLKAGLAVGTYSSESVTLTATGATTVSITCNGKVVAQPTVDASPNPYNVCTGSTATLSGSGTNITSYYWTGPNSFSSYLQNPSLGTVTATNSGKYVLTGSVGSGVNLLTNGDFESGNTGFGTTYDFNNSLSQTYGAYWINSNPWNVNNTYFISASDHTSGSGTLQMVVDGAETAGAIIWSQTISVSPNTAYQFSYWGENINSQGNTNYAKLQVYVNNVPTGAINTLSTTSWGQYYVNVNSGSSTSLQLTLINSFVGGSGNDFAIDDLNFEQVFEVKDTLTLTVNPIVTPTVTITASQNPSSTGASVTYTATPTNGGTTPVYTWYVNDVQMLTGTSATYSYVPTSGDKIKCVLASSISCSNSATSNIITQVVNAPTNYWRGTNSTDWGTASNWTAGYVPAAGADVIYASSSNGYGSDAINNLVLDKDRTQGSLINQTTKSLIIPTGKTLTVNNTITTDNNADRIYIQADDGVINGSLIFYSNSTVYGTMEMYSKAYIDAASTAVNSKYKWQYFGIPVESVVAEPTFYGSYVRKWVETGQDSTTHWVSLTNQSVLEAFKGYEITQPSAKKLYFQGKLNNQDYTTPTLSYTSTVDYPGQHVLANSYSAALNIARITFGSDVTPIVYLYNTGSMRDWYSQSLPSSGDAGNAGQYVGVTPATAGQSGLPDRIPSMQGFVVQTSGSTSNSYVSFNYQNAIVKNTTLMRVQSSSTETENNLYSSTVVSLKAKNVLDKLWLFTIPNTTKGYDRDYDVPKLTGSSIESEIHNVSDDIDYQINSSSDINNSVIAVKFAIDTTYTLHFDHYNQSENYSAIYLYDAEENKVIDITASSSEYSFYAKSTSTAVPRFRILTSYESNDSEADGNIKIFSTGGTIFVKNNLSESGYINLYDVSGRLVKKVQMDKDGVITAINGLKKGCYIVNAYADKEKNNKQVIVF